MKHLLTHTVLAVLTIFGTLNDYAPAAARIRVVAYTGQVAPGTTDGEVFQDFQGINNRGPVLNNAGQTAFLATLARAVGGVIEENERGIWTEGSGALDLAAREESHPPGTALNSAFARLDDPVLNDLGQTAFWGWARVPINDASFNLDHGLWIRNNDTTMLLFGSGQQASDLPLGNNYYSVGSPALNNRGEIAFRSYLQFNFDGGVWAGNTSSPELVARELEHAPGVEPNVGFRHFLYDPRYNDAGQAAFLASLYSGSNDNEKGLWTGDGSTLRLVAREGNSASDAGDGVLLGEPNVPSLNAKGEIAFSSRLQVGPGGVTLETDQAVWIDVNEGLKIVARSGESAPGTATDVVFLSFNSPIMGDDGNCVFRGFLKVGAGGVNEANRVGIWAGNEDALSMIARAGEVAPGTNGAIFSTFDFESININSDGQIAFLAMLQSNNGFDQGIWAHDKKGDLQLILSSGDTLEVSPGANRTVEELGLLGHASGQGSGFNDLGQIAFYATFTDGTAGIFVSDRVTVPEPRMHVLAAAVGTVAMPWRRTRRKRYALESHG